MHPCLSLTELARLCEAGSDAVPEAAAHVQDCPDCRDRLEQMRADQALATDIRRVDESSRQLGRAALPPVDGYELLREIGRGGMGVVYEAIQPHLGRVVALKVLPALLHSLQPDSVRRFKAEAAAAARLQHPNIVPIYDYGEEEACHYYAMELIRGVPLSALIESPDEGRGAAGGRDHFRRVARWMAEVADALQLAHDNGVVHRDIKPSNLILSDQDRLMVTDFGLVKAAGAEGSTRTQHILGTWRYMSPEQVRGDQAGVDHRTDVYSLGVTLYETLTHQPAVAGRDDHEILRNVLEQEPVAPRRLNPAVPRALETICLKAMARDAASRYPTAAALRDDLRRFLDDRPIQARGPMLPARMWMFARRHRLMVALVSVVVLLFTSAFFASAYFDARINRAELQMRSASELVRRANDLAASGQVHQAIAVYTLALENDPSLTYIFLRRARTRARIGQFQVCLQDLDAAIQRTARSDRLWFMRGVVQIMLGDRGAGRADLARAQQQNPELLEARVFAWLLQVEETATAAGEAASDHAAVQGSIAAPAAPLPGLDEYVAGRRTADEVLAAAADARGLLLARCAVGRLAALRRDWAAAQPVLQACGADETGEDIIPVFCRWQLQQMDSDGSATPP
jgi:tetratricopeptide (TPR) repeat protein